MLFGQVREKSIHVFTGYNLRVTNGLSAFLEKVEITKFDVVKEKNFPVCFVGLNNSLSVIISTTNTN